MIALRALAFNVAFYLNTAAFMIASIPLFLTPRRITIKSLLVWGKVTRCLHRLIVGARVELRGTENLPQGACLVASKHQSAWDTCVLPSFFADPAIVLKRELTWIPLYGWFIHKFGMISLNRGGGAAAMRALREAAKREAANGRQILIFPEGTRKVPGAEPDYKPGVALLYNELGLPCLPVALNSGLFWPRRKAMRYPGTIIVEFLPPIPPGLARREFIKRLEEAIETATNRLVAETARSPGAPPTIPSQFRSPS